jgi:hypothetical protein
MATLDDLVADEAAVKANLQALVDAFHALQAGTLTAAQQATVDAVDAALKADATTAADAVNPPPPPAP